MTNHPIAIIAAIAKETPLLVSKLTNRQEEIYAGMQIYQGLLCNTPVVILQSGHGKVSAALGTSTLIERYHAKFIISTGVAGALQSNIAQGHIIIGNELAYHDSHLNALEHIANPIPAAPNHYLSDDTFSHLILKTAQNLYPTICHEGLIVSGDTFIEKKENILQTFPTALAVDTQSAAIAQTCFYHNTPYAIIRAISDQADRNALKDYKIQIEKTAQQSCNIVLNILCQKQQLLKAS